jgi:hypothetical protein
MRKILFTFLSEQMFLYYKNKVSSNVKMLLSSILDSTVEPFPHACTHRDHESRALCSLKLLPQALHLIQIAEPGLGEGDAS